jgi:hypothetical protein
VERSFRVFRCASSPTDDPAGVGDNGQMIARLRSRNPSSHPTCPSVSDLRSNRQRLTAYVDESVAGAELART